MKFYMWDYTLFYLSGPVLRDSSTQVEDNTNRPLGLSKEWPWLLNGDELLKEVKLLSFGGKNFKTLNTHQVIQGHYLIQCC